MPEDDEKEILRIAEAIRRYLNAHPYATDSLGGIVNWWLTRQRYQDTKEQVAKALARLVAEGLVKETKTSEGRSIYGISDQRYTTKH